MVAIAAAFQNELGAEVRLVCASKVVGDAWVSAGLPTPTTVRPGLSRWTTALRMYRPALRLGGRKASYILFDRVQLILGLLLRFATLGGDGGVFLDLHDSMEGVRRRSRILMLMAIVMTEVICVSDYVRRQLPRGAKAVTVRRPVTGIGLRDLRHSSRSSLRILIAGQIAPHKKIMEGIRAVAEANCNCELVVRGAPSEDPQYAERAIELGHTLLGRRFSYDGVVAVENLYSDVDLLIMMNSTEPSGRTVAEAQLAGVVPIVPDQGGAVEFVDGGEAGGIYGKEDGASLPEVIERLANDSKLFSRLSRNARCYAEVHYSASVVRQYWDVIHGRA